MMRMATARRRAEDFAEAVEGRRLDAAAYQETLAFVALVEQLRELDPPRLRPAFASDLREQLMAAAATELSSDSRRADAAIIAFPTRPTGRRVVSVAAAVCIVAGSGVAVAAASQSALPGDALYPVKRGIERIEVYFSGSSQDRGYELLGQASTRLDEVGDLVVARPDDLSTPVLMGEALEDFSQQATDGAEALLTAYREDNSDASITALRRFADESAIRLEAVAATLPVGASDELATAIAALRDLDAQAMRACPSCSSLPALEMSSLLIELRTLEAGAADSAVSPSAPATVQKPGHTKQGSEGSNSTLPTVEGTSTATPTLIAVVPTELDTNVSGPTPEPTSEDIVPTATVSEDDDELPGGTIATTSVPTVPLPSLGLTASITTVPDLLDNPDELLGDGQVLP